MVWIGVRNFYIKEMLGLILWEMLSKFLKTHVFILAITFPLLIQIE